MNEQQPTAAPVPNCGTFRAWGLSVPVERLLYLLTNVLECRVSLDGTPDNGVNVFWPTQYPAIPPFVELVGIRIRETRRAIERRGGTIEPGEAPAHWGE